MKINQVNFLKSCSKTISRATKEAPRTSSFGSGPSASARSAGSSAVGSVSSSSPVSADLQPDSRVFN